MQPCWAYSYCKTGWHFFVAIFFSYLQHYNRNNGHLRAQPGEESLQLSTLANKVTVHNYSDQTHCLHCGLFTFEEQTKANKHKQEILSAMNNLLSSEWISWPAIVQCFQPFAQRVSGGLCKVLRHRFGFLQCCLWGHTWLPEEMQRRRAQHSQTVWTSPGNPEEYPASRNQRKWSCFWHNL